MKHALFARFILKSAFTKHKRLDLRQHEEIPLVIPKSLIFHYFLLLGTVGFIDKVKQSGHYDNNVQSLGFLHNYAKHAVKVNITFM